MQITVSPYQLFNIVMGSRREKGFLFQGLLVTVPEIICQKECFFTKGFLSGNGIHTAVGRKPLSDQGNTF